MAGAETLENKDRLVDKMTAFRVSCAEVLLPNHAAGAAYYIYYRFCFN